MLEDKIKEYLYNLKFYDYRLSEDLGTLKNKMAKDIAEIVEKEYEEKFNEFIKVTDRYEKENTTINDVNNSLGDMVNEQTLEIEQLKQKVYKLEKALKIQSEIMIETREGIADIKYLNREEVEKIICKHICFCSQEGVENCVTAICNLAIPITKDRIFKVLGKYFNYKYVDFEQIANEILKEE